MIKHHYFSFLFLGTLLLLSSCRPQEMEMRHFTFEATYPLVASDTARGALSLTADVELPVKFRDRDVLRNIQKQIIAKIFGEWYNSVPIDSVLTQYADMIAAEYRKSSEPFLQKIIEGEDSTNIWHTAAMWQNQIEIQGIAMFADDKILSYSYERYAYMGGAHGNSSRLLYNFDLNTSRLITEHDLFISGYESSLQQLIKQQIVEDNAEMESIADLDEFNFFEDEIKPNNNFFITGDGLVYVYNPYDIAPYSTGQIEVALSFERLRPLLKPGNPLTYFYR